MKQAVWLSRILKDIDSKNTKRIPVRFDYQGAILLVHNQENQKGTKHIEVKCLYVRKQQQTRSVDVVYVGTKDQQADGVIIGLPRLRFEELWSQLGVAEFVSN
jgi:hypothetical protein